MKGTLITPLLLFCGLWGPVAAAPRNDASTGGAVAQATCYVGMDGSAGFLE